MSEITREEYVKSIKDKLCEILKIESKVNMIYKIILEHCDEFGYFVGKNDIKQVKEEIRKIISD